jgi:DNA mismatch repair ATPase MutS
LQEKLLGNEQKASSQISNLKDILNRFDVRLNVLLFTILNTLFLWDVWQIRSLFGWKKQHNLQLKNWMATIAEIELINTLSIIHFNHPTWIFPTIVDPHFTFQAKGLGHPLLPIDKSVTNAFTTEGTGKIVLITGSNMAGKSTFLRAVGCNVVLALMGAPVCAEQLTLSPIKLLSSMRIADNLAESTSTFYAELKKLKSIIESVNNHEKVLVLLDEILRGTNSLDRHTGSKALIKQFIRQNTIAILATHDVSLADESLVFPENITNYHFDVQVANDELFFDYQLKSGVCKSLNASILMRKIGIEMEKD